MITIIAAVRIRGADGERRRFRVSIIKDSRQIRVRVSVRVRVAGSTAKESVEY
jgi:hypothetical protein